MRKQRYSEKWKWHKEGYFPRYQFKRGMRYKGVRRCSHNFPKSQKRKFILAVVERLGETERFMEMVHEYKQRRFPEYAAFHRALHEIGQALKNTPAFDIETPNFDHLLP